MKENNKAILKNIGFKELRDYRKKITFENILVWSNLLDAGESISIKLVFENDVWNVSNIKYTGIKSKELYHSNLANESLEEVISFVKRYPINTF